MNWMCDVYVYEDCSGGWTTHVAGRRRIFPPIPDYPMGRLPTFGGYWNKETRKLDYPNSACRMMATIVYTLAAFWHNRVHMASLRLIPYRDLNLGHEGKTFHDETAGECADRLEMLRSAGYIVPDYAIQALREESLEAST